jgi:hypothetical protein
MIQSQKGGFLTCTSLDSILLAPSRILVGGNLGGIDNTLGIYVKAFEETRQRRYTSYARICVYLNISNPPLG